MRHSFKEHGNFYTNYMIRTLCEFLVAAAMTTYVWLTGMLQIQKDLHPICLIHKTYYQCSGVPTQFYLYILIIALAMLVVYLVSFHVNSKENN